MTKTYTATSPPREGEPAGTRGRPYIFMYLSKDASLFLNVCHLLWLFWSSVCPVTGTFTETSVGANTDTGIDTETVLQQGNQ